MFEYHWDKRRKENEGEPKYISLCHILQYSGEDREFIEATFNKYMEIGVDYDEPERETMIEYLIDIAKDLDD